MTNLYITTYERHLKVVILLLFLQYECTYQNKTDIYDSVCFSKIFTLDPWVVCSLKRLLLIILNRWKTTPHPFFVPTGLLARWWWRHICRHSICDVVDVTPTTFTTKKMFWYPFQNWEPKSLKQLPASNLILTREHRPQVLWLSFWLTVCGCDWECDCEWECDCNWECDCECDCDCDW